MLEVYRVGPLTGKGGREGGRDRRRKGGREGGREGGGSE